MTGTKVDIAVEQYVKGLTSLDQSAKVAGVSFWKFLDELRRKKVALKADAESEIDRHLARKK